MKSLKKCFAALFFRCQFFLRRHLVWKFKKPTYVLLLGGPGAGKGTLASQLSQHLGISHISTGALIRQEIATGSPLGKRLEHYVSQGKLVEDKDADMLLVNCLKLSQNAHGAILDGFPRTLPQAQRLDEILSGWGLKVNKVICIELAEEVLIERLAFRRTCTNHACGQSYHLKQNPPERENTCNKCGSALYQRADDNAEAIKERLAFFQRESRPLLEYYTANSTGTNLVAFLHPKLSTTKEEVLQEALGLFSH
jgi:adenylate kinase